MTKMKRIGTSSMMTLKSLRTRGQLRCNSHCQAPFHSSVRLNSAWAFCCFHSLHCDRCTSSHIFNPLVFFNFTCVCLFIGVFHEGNVTVLVAISVRTASLCSFFIGALAVGFFFFIFIVSARLGFLLVFSSFFVWTMRRSILH